MLNISRYFTTEDVHPFDAVAWEVGDVVIQGKDGPVFEAKGVQFPAFWGQRARDIVASKYFRVVDGEKETSAKQMLTRVVDTISGWGYHDRYFGDDTSDIFVCELTHILLNQYASFNSPVWFNVGVQECPQTSACYILDVEDSMESILEWYRQEGMIFKGGSGSGVNLSKIRPKGAPLSGGGTSSGVMSFARVADANAGAIKSGGTTRRAAKLLVLDVNHPDIEEFIQCKVDAERLASHLMEIGYGNGIEGGAYDNVPWQNANNSVNVSDIFMANATAEDGVHTTRVSQAYVMLQKIAAASWECGDPGLFFRDTINAWHTTPGNGRIVSANPCGEFLRPPNEACNLASINLLKFLKDDGAFDIPAFCHTVDILITAMDILIDRSSYPTETIAQNSKDYRPLGLGYSNLGAFLMAQGLPYDSDAGRALAASITALSTGRAYKRSAEIAKVKGAFTGYAQNSDTMLAVIERHRKLAESLKNSSEHAINHCANDTWSALAGHALCSAGFRNCQVTVLAPCGTISFMMDCDTTGVEPCIGLVTTKKLVGGGEVQMVNGIVARALRALVAYPERTIDAQIKDLRTRGAFVCKSEHISVFATALGDNAISWQGHIKMVSAVQPFLSGGCSKTINMPHDSTVQDVFDAYVMAWRSGLKAISIYRDGSKGTQPVTVSGPAMSAAAHLAKLVSLKPQQELDEHKNTSPPMPTEEEWSFPKLTEEEWALLEDAPSARKRLPAERKSITHKFTINAHEGYLTVGLYDNGSPGELFLRMSKEGSTLSGLIDAWATMVSIALQYGVPLDVITSKFKDTQFDPRGFTGNPEIKTSSSVLDYISRWLENKFLHDKRVQQELERAGVNGDRNHLPFETFLTSKDAALQETKEDRSIALARTLMGARHEGRKTEAAAHFWLEEFADSSKTHQDNTEPERNRFEVMVAYAVKARQQREARMHNFFGLGEQVRLGGNGALTLCFECGGMTQRAGSCCVCTVCGTSTGCA